MWLNYYYYVYHRCYIVIDNFPFIHSTGSEITYLVHRILKTYLIAMFPSLRCNPSSYSLLLHNEACDWNGGNRNLCNKSVCVDCSLKTSSFTSCEVLMTLAVYIHRRVLTYVLYTKPIEYIKRKDLNISGISEHFRNILRREEWL